MPNTINEYFKPSSTGVHNNIDNFILQAKLDEFDKTGIMRAQPEDPRSVANALSRDFVEGLLPIGAGIKLFRGVPKWVKGQMVREGTYKSPPNLLLKRMKKEMDDYLVNRTGGAPFLDPEGYYGEYLPSIIKGLGTWASKSKKEALDYAKLGKKGERMLLEFDVPNKVFKEKIKSANPFRRETWFEGGIPKEYLKKVHKGFQQGGTVESDATKVHNNIDNLILQAELDKLAQTGSMRVDRTPEYIGGVDPIVENVALSPILTLKGLGSVGKKILEKTGLRNPISHYTSGENMASILNRKKIVGTGEFPGRRVPGQSASAVSLTRDPMFPSRGQGSIGTDTRFIFDRDELIKKGFLMKPIAVGGYRKVSSSFPRGVSPESYRKIYGKYPKQMNPRFEFEERVRGSIPTENVKLIDILRLPLGYSGYSYSLLNLLGQLSRTNIPIIKSPETTRRLKSITESIEIDDIISRGNREFGINTTIDDIYRLIDKPTYKFDPFKEVR
tara:strand:+ start:1179 stop:2678 length:1500 start_codon:yes stop_codon:yes gene_type:complete